MAGGIDRLSVVCAGHEESVDQFIIYAGYGEVMHRLQVLELSLWMIQSRGIKSQTRLDQAMAKVEKWNATTLGELPRAPRRGQEVAHPPVSTAANSRYTTTVRMWLGSIVAQHDGSNLHPAHRMNASALIVHWRGVHRHPWQRP